jgi:hypothetical protein
MSAVCQIKVGRAAVALVDEAAVVLVGGVRWYRQGAYAAGQLGRRTVLMHRLILPPPARFIIDHINGNGLDNRRANLRLATAAQNRWNARASRRGGWGGLYRGVTRLGATRWKASIAANGQREDLGCFATAELAARAYDAGARRLHGEFARLNFPGPYERAVREVAP